MKHVLVAFALLLGSLVNRPALAQSAVTQPPFSALDVGDARAVAHILAYRVIGRRQEKSTFLIVPDCVSDLAAVVAEPLRMELLDQGFQLTQLPEINRSDAVVFVSVSQENELLVVEIGIDADYSYLTFQRAPDGRLALVGGGRNRSERS